MMFRTIALGGRASRARRTPNAGNGSVAGSVPAAFPLLVFVVGVCGVAASRAQDSAHAASTASRDEPLKITISDAASAGRLISVPVHKSVLVEFSAPVREARIAKSEIAEVAAITPRQIVVTGKTFGVTQLIVFANEHEQHVFDIAVDIELERLQASIRAAVPRATVKAQAVLDAVVLAGLVPDAESADTIMQIASIYATKVMNQMRVAGTQQVVLRCTIAEVNRTAVRQLGFNGWIAGDNVRDMFFLNNLNQINPSNIGAPEGAVVTQRIPFLVGKDGIPVTGSSTLSFGFPRVEMQVFVQALRENGLLRILAEPNVVAVNGQVASFLAGGEIPVPIVTDEKIKIDWKEFGVRLAFQPSILNENAIRIHVKSEVSEPDFNSAVVLSGVAVPSFTTRRLETVVEIGSGQTFAIGGLLSEKVRGITRKVPAVGDIPVLGALFSSIEYQSNQTELVVLVTPELVEPVSPDQITCVPGATMIEPNDFEFYMLGQLEGKADESRPALRPRLNNPWPVRAADRFDNEVSMKMQGPIGHAGYDEGQ